MPINGGRPAKFNRLASVLFHRRSGGFALRPGRSWQPFRATGGAHGKGLLQHRVRVAGRRGLENHPRFQQLPGLGPRRGGERDRAGQVRRYGRRRSRLYRMVGGVRLRRRPPRWPGRWPAGSRAGSNFSATGRRSETGSRQYAKNLSRRPGFRPIRAQFLRKPCDFVRSGLRSCVAFTDSIWHRSAVVGERSPPVRMRV